MAAESTIIKRSQASNVKRKYKFVRTKEFQCTYCLCISVSLMILMPFLLILGGYTRFSLLINLHPISEKFSAKYGNQMRKDNGTKNVTFGSAVLRDRGRYVCPIFGPRLGNLLFLYASSYGIAFDNNLTLALSLKDPIYEPFLIPKPIKDRRYLCRHHVHVFQQQRPGYYEKPAIPSAGNFRMTGFLQSWKYFANSFNDLRRQLKFKPRYDDDASRILQLLVRERYPNLNPKTVTTVGIHIRRGDRIGERNAVADFTYIEAAKHQFLKNYSHVLFIVATNTDAEAREWCITNVINGTGTSVFTGFNHRFTDMAIMSKCDHMIMSTGTYGWWSAFLNNGTVYYYDWMPRNHYKFVSEDYFPPHWIGIKSTTTYPTYIRFD